VSNSPGDLDQDGYNESTGVYECQPSNGQVRVLLDQPEFAIPVNLRVRTTIGQVVHAYQDGRRVPHLIQDAQGLTVVPIDSRIRRVEIFVSGEAQAADSATAATP
jgi:hypothetical protein